MKSFMRYSLAGLMAVSATVCSTVALRAQTPAVELLDPSAAQLIAPNTPVETLKNEFFAFVEGPVWVPEGAGGYLLFSDLPANCIYKWQDGKLSVFMEKSGFTGPDASVAGFEINNGRFQTMVIGSNGLTLDQQGRLIIAQHGDRRLVRREKDGTLTVLADRYEGKRLGGPNDVVAKSNGAIFFTDPPAGMRGGDKSPLRELDFHGVYMVKDGKLTLIDKDPLGSQPNGIALSPDERTLYVTAGRKLAAYDLSRDDKVGKVREFFDYTSATKEPSGFDGIKVDTKGNIWGSGAGGTWIISPKGKALARIRMPEGTTNLAFGDADGKGLYVVAKRGLYRIRTLVPGVHPIPKQ